MYCICTCNVCVYLPFSNGTLLATSYLVYFKLWLYHCHFIVVIASVNSVIVSSFNWLSFVLSPWRWPLKWPKHVGGYCMRQRFYFSVHFVVIWTTCCLVGLVPSFGTCYFRLYHRDETLNRQTVVLWNLFTNLRDCTMSLPRSQYGAYVLFLCWEPGWRSRYGVSTASWLVRNRFPAWATESRPAQGST